MKYDKDVSLQEKDIIHESLKEYFKMRDKLAKDYQELMDLEYNKYREQKQLAYELHLKRVDDYYKKIQEV